MVREIDSQGTVMPLLVLGLAVVGITGTSLALLILPIKWRVGLILGLLASTSILLFIINLRVTCAKCGARFRLHRSPTGSIDPCPFCGHSPEEGRDM